MVLIFMIFFNKLNAQENDHRFRLIDNQTRLPLSFATVIINYPSEILKTTDIDGYFAIDKKIELKNIRISYIGYESKDFFAPFKPNQTFSISRKIESLQEVTINPDDKEQKIIKKVIENKKLNNYLNYDFDAKIYAKSTIQVIDTSYQLKENLKHLFIFDNINVLSNNKNLGFSEKVTESEAPGFKMPVLSSLISEVMPMHFYQDQLLLIDAYYTNPLSSKGMDEYHFQLEPVENLDIDTIYRIVFKPKGKYEKVGLVGVAEINGKSFAIQKMAIEPRIKGFFFIKIAHEYDALKPWFPKVFTAQVYYPQIIANTPPFRLSVEAHFDKDKPNPAGKNIGILDSLRSIHMNEEEIASYILLDSILSKSKLPKILNIGSKLINGRWPAKWFDINLDKVLAFNLYEKTRLGLGISTNERLSKVINFSSYYGYGFGDKASKYGSAFGFKISPSTNFIVMYDNTIAETGLHNNDKVVGSLNSRSVIGSRFDKMKSYNVGINTAKNGFSFKINAQHGSFIPLYDYSFASGEYPQNFVNSQVAFEMRYQHNTNYILILGNKLKSSVDGPDVSFSITKGFENVFNSQFEYVKLQSGINHNFYIQNIGTTHFSLQAGLINKPVPIGMLFEGRGSFDRNLPFVIKNYFQTSRPYEFIHDRYAYLFYKHTFDHLFTKSKFAPLFSLHCNAGIGNLSNQNLHNMVKIKTMSRPLIEPGVEINRILKFNYLNVMYAGLGFGVFTRVGSHSATFLNENLFFKITASFHTR